MKKIFILIAVLLFSATVSYAQTFNAAVEDHINLKTQVIKPLIVENGQWISYDMKFPLVIAGQKRIITTSTGWSTGTPPYYWVFDAKREAGKEVTLTFEFGNPVNGVEIEGQWGIFALAGTNWNGDTYPGAFQEPAGDFLNSGTYIWDTDIVDNIKILLRLNSIDATTTTETGTRTFTATVTGWYSSL